MRWPTLLLLLLVAGPAAADTLAVLPDTQNYLQSHPELLVAQTGWLAARADSLDLRGVVTLGDLTQDNTPAEWELVAGAFGQLDGVAPWFPCEGNHDLGPGGKALDRSSGIDGAFPPSLYTPWPSFGGTREPGAVSNAWWKVQLAGREWMVLVLEWSPRDATVQWAHGRLAAHPSRPAIVVTHAYLFPDDSRYDVAEAGLQPGNPCGYPTADLPGGCHDGQRLWEELLSHHRNVVLVLSGHATGDGAGRLASRALDGHTVWQLHQNYQHWARGGDGFLRLLHFGEGGHELSVETLSPALGRALDDPQHRFTLRLDLPPAAP